jgi:hypothetical protein
MAAESYKLGLRTLGMIARSMAASNAQLRELIEKAGIKVFADLSKEEREKQISKFLFWIVSTVTFAIVKTVSQAVGSTQLRETYREVLESEGGMGVSLIDVSVRLDHLRPFPEDELFGLYKNARKNEFVRTLLRTLALEHLYLYPCKQNLIQTICSRMDISVKNPRFFDPRLKIE